MDDFIYLELDEEITSVIDRLRESKGNRIGIVVPRGAMVLQSVVNLKLIQREAKKAKKFVGIITVDKVGRSLASQIGLPVFDDPKQAESSSDLSAGKESHKVVSDVIEIDMSQGGDELPEGVNVNYYTGESHAGEEAKAEAVLPEAKVEKSAAGAGFSARKVAAENIKGNKLPASVSPAGRRRKLWWKIVISLAAVVIAAVAAWVTLSRATVRITVPAEPYEAKAEVKVDATLMNSQPKEGIIKGNLVSAEKEMSKKIKATGIKKVGAKAKGNITFYNDSGMDQSVASGAGVTASGGKKFTLKSAITIPKATLDASGKKVQGKTTGTIEASESGTEYNLPSSTSYVVSGNNYTTGSGETSGGTSEEKKVVSQGDISGAKDSLVAEAPNQLRDEVTKAAKGEYIVESAINFEAANFSTDKKAGDEADSFTAKANVKAQVISFAQNDLRTAVAGVITPKLPKGQSLLTSEDDTITPEVKSVDLPKKEMVINAKMASHVGNAVSTDGLAKQIKGKAVKSARRSVADSMKVNVEDVQIAVTPNVGLVRLPFITKNIRFKLEYKKVANENSSS